LQSVFVTTLII